MDRKPGRQCSICIHESRGKIDKLLVGGTSYRNIAKQFGLSITALSRHKNNHIPAALMQAKEVKKVVAADNLLDEIKDLQDRAISILEKAEVAGELGVALRGIREARECLKLLAELEGRLWERHKLDVESVVVQIIDDV